jgi:hypothetical protein
VMAVAGHLGAGARDPGLDPLSQLFRGCRHP